jgi:hypothetical protein
MRRMPVIQASNRQLPGSFEGGRTMTSGDLIRVDFATTLLGEPSPRGSPATALGRTARQGNWARLPVWGPWGHPSRSSDSW